MKIIAAFVILHIILLSILFDTDIQAKKDCSLSGISPDYTAKEKEQCANLREKK
jgi:hypothetical protein